MNYFMMLYDRRGIKDGARFEEFGGLTFPDYMFDKCVSLKENYSDDVTLEMDKGSEDRRALYDITNNINQLLITSEPFKEILETCDCGNVEFLPVSIKNQRDKIEKEKYYIVHLVDSIDYLNKEKSIIEYRALDESQIACVEDIELQHNNIPGGRSLFRADYYPNRYVVNEDLKNKIEDEEFEGMIFVPIEEYDSALF